MIETNLKIRFFKMLMKHVAACSIEHLFPESDPEAKYTNARYLILFSLASAASVSENIHEIKPKPPNQKKEELNKAGGDTSQQLPRQTSARPRVAGGASGAPAQQEARQLELTWFDFEDDPDRGLGFARNVRESCGVVTAPAVAVQ